MEGLKASMYLNFKIVYILHFIKCHTTNLKIVSDPCLAFYKAWPDPVQEMSVSNGSERVVSRWKYMCGGNPYLIYPGMNTVLTPQSNDSIHFLATSPLFNPPTFGSASLTFPPSTAPALKSPSTVAGKMKLKRIEGCSMESDW